MKTKEKIKRNILNMSTKDFGIFFEKIIKKELNLDDSKNEEYDGIKNNKKVEIKVSRIIKKINKRKFKNYYDYLFQYEKTLLTENELLTGNYDCNIQQVKPYLFDELVYGLLLDKKLLLFKINNQIFKNNPGIIKYVNKQHRGNKDEGQFHINSSNIKIHLENFFFKKIDFDKILELSKTIKR